MQDSKPQPAPNLQCDAANSDQSVEEMMDMIRYCPPGPWPEGWVSWGNVHEAHKRLLEEFILKIQPYPANRFKPGRCILSCVTAKPGWSSGKVLQHGYLPAAWVLINELRRFGCKLPIYFAHLGQIEWSPRLTELVEPLGVKMIDLRSIERRYPARVLAGWETKAYAIEHCPYEEVMFLDADNVPIRDPSYLFDEPLYQEHGAMFWPDLPPHDRREWLPSLVWDSVGLEYDARPDFESGQMLVNKRKHWKALQITRWINDHSDRFYKIVFGDKSTFRLGWAKAGSNYAIPRGPGWNGGAILQHDLQGRLLFEHCVQNKCTLDGYSKMKGDLPNHLTNSGECRDHLAKLKSLWDGRLWDGAEGADVEIAESLIGKTFLYRRVGLGERQLRLLEDNRVGKGGARCEFSWGVVEGKLAISDVDGKPTMILSKRPDGVWVGEWLEHEKCAVELVPE